MNISKHTPENCWMFNKEARKVHLDIAEKLPEIMQKYGIKLLGCWFDDLAHMMVEVYEAPTAEAFQKMSMEPEIVMWGAYNTSEVRMVIGLEDVMKILKQSK